MERLNAANFGGNMRTTLQVLGAGLLLITAAAWANGGSSMTDVPRPSSLLRQQSPEQQARDAYNDGVRDVKKADQAQSTADQTSDAGRKERAVKEAQRLYASAHVKFQNALEVNAELPEAWNYSGYTSRKLGNYEEALAAYNKALALRPGYPDALEYRAETYLGLRRVADAQRAYLDLYASSRPLADKLLTAMKNWLAAQPAGAATDDSPSLEDLDKWINERSQISAQTAALTRAGTAAAWR
jgi:tetratricopeptide (TPR) repeat protein